MKKHNTILAALAAFLLPLCASAEQLKLTVDQVFGLSATLAQLDAGVTHVIKSPASPEEGKEPAPDRIVSTAYDFAPAVRLAIYRDQRELQAQLSDFEKSRAALVKTIWGDRTPDEKKDVEEMKRFKSELAATAAVQVKVEITKLKPEDLYRNGNPIPTAVMLGLQPILADPAK